MYHAYLVRVTNMQLDLTRAQKKLSIASFNLLHNRRNTFILLISIIIELAYSVGLNGHYITGHQGASGQRR